VPVNLGTLFCTPSDVWDILSVEGVDLREDDHNLASGQIIQTSSDTAIGSSTMSVAALPVALLAGTQLVFDGAGMPNPVQVQLTNPANAGATSLSIQQVFNNGTTITVGVTSVDIPSGAQARDSGVNAATGMRLVRACQRGTSKVKLYTNTRYDDSALVQAGSVNNWASIVAAKWLCTRRAQGCPAGLQADYDEALDELRQVQAGQLYIEDIGTRGVDWPTVTNITVNPSYNVMRARVQPNISEQTPTAYSQYIDWNSAMWLEF
jgi:hypothetical protein